MDTHDGFLYSHYSGSSHKRVGILYVQLLQEFLTGHFGTLEIFGHGLKMCYFVHVILVFSLG